MLLHLKVLRSFQQRKLQKKKIKIKILINFLEVISTHLLSNSNTDILFVIFNLGFKIWENILKFFLLIFFKII